MARIPALSFLTLLAVPLAGRAQNQAGPPAVSFALAHVTVIDMTGAPPQSDMTVVVTGNRIATLGPSRAVRIPKGGLTFDATGKFLIPGLWDMHVHAAWSSTLPTFGPLFLVNGVTGVREMWGSLDLVASARSEEHTSELQSLAYLVCRLLLEKKKNKQHLLTTT